MSSRDLDIARDNARFGLERALVAITQGTARSDDYFNAGFYHRFLAICLLLRDGDVDGFVAHLTNAGRARLHLLQAVARGLAATPAMLCTSKDIFFAASVAAGDLDTARAIASASRATHDDSVEYEEDFLFMHFLHRALLDPQGLQPILKRWRAVLEGSPSGYLSACASLVSSSAEAFATGFAALIAERQRELAGYREQLKCNRELYVTEGKVFIEGLAVLRLAELRGIPTAPQYPLIQRWSRIPIGAALPGPAAWMQP